MRSDVWKLYRLKNTIPKESSWKLKDPQSHNFTRSSLFGEAVIKLVSRLSWNDPCFCWLLILWGCWTVGLQPTVLYISVGIPWTNPGRYCITLNVWMCIKQWFFSHEKSVIFTQHSNWKLFYSQMKLHRSRTNRKLSLLKFDGKMTLKSLLNF